MLRDDSEGAVKKRRVARSPVARVFVGNLPLPRDIGTPEEFQEWFEREMQRVHGVNPPKPPSPPEKAPVADTEPPVDAPAAPDNPPPAAPAPPLPQAPPIKEEAEPLPPGDDNIYTCGVDGWSAREGVCFVCLKSPHYLPLAVTLNGTLCMSTHLAVCPPQCLPDPSFPNLPVLAEQLPPLTSIAHWKNKGYLVFSGAPTHLAEQDLKSLFEALGGPLESMTLYSHQGASLGCGRCSFNNHLIIESVIQRIRNGQVGGFNPTVATLIDSRRADVLASLEKSTMGFTRSSLTEQLFAEPLTAHMLRTLRILGSNVTRIVQLSNFITLEDILCDTLRAELIAAVKMEAEKYGRLESLVCPTPNRLGEINPDAGCAKIFLEYADVTAARRAQYEFNGRSFDGRVVCASFYPLLPFQLRRYTLLSP